jgi:hypothetical protein
MILQNNIKEIVMDILIKKLSLVDSVRTYDWSTMEFFIELLKDSNDKIIKIEDFRDAYYKIMYPFNIKENFYYNIWRTFQNCRWLDIKYYNDNYLTCTATVYDSDNDSGARTKLRFILTSKIDINFIHHIENNIDYEFDKYLEKEYEKHLYNQKIKWISKIRSKLLED